MPHYLSISTNRAALLSCSFLSSEAWRTAILHLVNFTTTNCPKWGYGWKLPESAGWLTTGVRGALCQHCIVFEQKSVYHTTQQKGTNIKGQSSIHLIRIKTELCLFYVTVTLPICKNGHCMICQVSAFSGGLYSWQCVLFKVPTSFCRMFSQMIFWADDSHSNKNNNNNKNGIFKGM